MQDQTVFFREPVTGDDFFAFAGLAPLILQAPVKEEVFAEKIHAYTMPRENENTRVKDLLDLALLIEDGIDKDKLIRAIDGVFQIRGTHLAPIVLREPPSGWEKVFTALATEAKVEIELRGAFQQVSEVYGASIIPRLNP